MEPIFNEKQKETIHSSYHEAMNRAIDMFTTTMEALTKAQVGDDLLDVPDPIRDVVSSIGPCIMAMPLLIRYFNKEIADEHITIGIALLFGICLHRDMPDILERLSSGTTVKDEKDEDFTNFMKSIEPCDPESEEGTHGG